MISGFSWTFSPSLWGVVKRWHQLNSPILYISNLVMVHDSFSKGQFLVHVHLDILWKGLFGLLHCLSLGGKIVTNFVSCDFIIPMYHHIVICFIWKFSMKWKTKKKKLILNSGARVMLCLLFLWPFLVVIWSFSIEKKISICYLIFFLFEWLAIQKIFFLLEKYKILFFLS